ncbi:M23 family metallopeptidase [Georgenia daeguensis]|uniref:M23 family metallopeptidase n=1 Tax=Georgenia daeguensis TaxID=908355 RepID=UPI0031EAB302
MATAGSTDAAVASVAAIPVRDSVLTLLDARAATTSLAAGAPASLVADPTARARAEALQASRATVRAALETTAEDGANGTRAAVAEPQPLFVMPLAAGNYRLTSAYGYRNDPLGRGRSFHTGTDMAAPLGTPIYAVADGIVDYVSVGKDGRSSMLIVLKHEIDGRYVYSWYNHMYPDGLYVQEGQQVRAGEVIAAVGSNGNSTGPHLHLEIHTDDELTTTEPLTWLAEHGAVDIGSL